MDLVRACDSPTNATFEFAEAAPPPSFPIGPAFFSADALALEDASGDAAQTYANIIACSTGEENSEKIQALVKALQTDAVKTFIADSYNGAVVAIF